MAESTDNGQKPFIQKTLANTVPDWASMFKKKDC